MDIIYNYIESMFKALPTNKDMENLKNEMKINMEEKYNELKNEGKSENEAIGTVISEFGNIDEIIKEFGIEEHNEENESFRELTLSEINEFYNSNKRSSFMVSIGVILCLLGASVLISLTNMIDAGIIFSQVSENAKDVIAVSILLIFLVVAVALFILGRTMMEKYDYIRRGEFNISNSSKIIVQNKIQENKSQKLVGIIGGVCLCILSPMAIFISGVIYKNNGDIYGVSILLIIVAISVFLFINFGGNDKAYKNILKSGEYSDSNLKENKVIKSVARIIWPITTCTFLIWGFIFDGWKNAWIVFPIVAILFAMFSAVYKGVKN